MNRNIKNIEFTTSLVNNVGSIDRVLADFFDNQTQQIFDNLQQQFPGAPENALSLILNTLATLEGTKQPLRRTELSKIKLPPEQIDFCLSQLEKARILRLEDETYELAHDTLALHISEQRSMDEVALLEITKLVKDRYNNFDNTNTLLNEKETQWLANYKIKLEESHKLTEEEWAYVRKSEKEIVGKRRKKYLLIASIIAILGLFSLYANFARIQAKAASVEAKTALENLKAQQRESADATYNKHLAQGETHFNSAEYRAAISEYEKAFDIADAYPDDQWTGKEATSRIEQCKELLKKKDSFDSFMEQGNLLFSQGEAKYIDALESYQQALDLDYNNAMAQNRIANIMGKLTRAFEEFKKNGEIFFAAEAYSFALEQFKQAARINKTDKYIQSKLKECSTKLRK